MSRPTHALADGTSHLPRRIVAASVTAALALFPAAACAPAAKESAAPVTAETQETPTPVPAVDTQVNASSRGETIPQVWATDAEKVDAPSPSELEDIDTLLSDSVDDAATQGVTLTWCLRSLDTEKPVEECVGDDETTFAASIPKLAVAVAAIEAYEGDLDEVVIDGYTPWSAGNAGLRAAYDEAMEEEAEDDVIAAAEAAQENDAPTTLGDLVAASIAYSDNDAVNELLDVIPNGPAFGEVEATTGSAGTSAAGSTTSDAASDMTAFGYVDAITARVGIDEDFHVGAYFNEPESGDWNHITSSAATAYLSALVAAADGEVTEEDLTTVKSGALAAPKTARAVLSAMAQQFRATKIPGELPTGTFSNKTGETDTESHDLAVVGTKSGRYVLSAVSSFPAGITPPDEQLAETAKSVVGVLGGSERL